MHTLQSYFAEFDLALQDKILQFFQKRAFEKGDYFVQEGHTSHYLGFVESGAFQYFYNKDGNEITSYVSGENNFIASLASFLQEQPAKENIRALCEATVWQIHKKHFKELIAGSEVFKLFYIGLLEHLIVCIDGSRHDFIALNAEQRYEKMLNEEPHLLQQIPLQLLASILGVTPRHLSRIRKNIY